MNCTPEILKKREAFIKTMSFFDIFDFSLTCAEACEYMLYQKWTCDELTFFTNHEEFIIENNCNLYLKGRALTMNVRRDKEHRAKKLINKARKFIKYMQMLPFVRMVGICNSLAFFDAEKGSDIDIFIITEKNRMFFARLFAVIFTQILGIRRHGNRVKGRFCLSFMISAENMNLEKLKINDEDIYFIYWIRLLQPIIGQSTYHAFINENAWIKRFFEYEINQNKLLLPESKPLIRFQKVFEFLFKGRFGDFIEKLLKNWQKKRSENKAKTLENRDGILISDTILKFHDVDMRGKYSFMWKKRINQFSKYLIPSFHDREKQDLSQSLQKSTLYEVRSQDNADMKNAEPLHH